VCVHIYKAVLSIEPRALYMASKCSITESHPQSGVLLIQKNNYTCFIHFMICSNISHGSISYIFFTGLMVIFFTIKLS
jgi:hypothetical protein